MIKKILYYLMPILVAVLIFLSNFLNTKLFGSEIINFTIWFILALFIFACGWITNNVFRWEKGGKILIAVIVSTTVISALLVSFFSDYFQTGNLLFENIILYSLRNIFLGFMGVFGMAVSELLFTQQELAALKQIDHEQLKHNAIKESDLIIREANVKADKIVLEATKKSLNL